MKLVNPQWLPVGQMEKAVTWPCSAVPCRVTDVRFRASAVHFLQAYCVAWKFSESTVHFHAFAHHGLPRTSGRYR